MHTGLLVPKINPEISSVKGVYSQELTAKCPEFYL